jgi:hypothetical protein
MSGFRLFTKIKVDLISLWLQRALTAFGDV